MEVRLALCQTATTSVTDTPRHAITATTLTEDGSISAMSSLSETAAASAHLTALKA